MKRLILTAVIACAVVGVCLFGVHTVTRDCDEIYNRLSHIEQLCQADADELEAACTSLEAYWCEIEPRLTFFVNHQTARTIGESISMLPPLSTAEDKAEFLSECRAAKTRLLHLKQQESFSLRNVF